MNVKLLVALFRTMLVLMPLLYVVMEGAKPTVALFVGGVLAVVLLPSSLRVAWIPVCAPLVGGVALYAALAFFARELVDSFVFHHALLGVFYALPAGFYLHETMRRGQERAVETALLLAALALGAVATHILTAIGPDTLKVWRGGDLQRLNLEEAFQYLYFFEVKNVMLGTVPMTIPALASVTLIFSRSAHVSKLILLLAFAFACYVVLETATRTAAAATIFSTIVTLALVIRALDQRGRLRALGSIVLFVVLGTVLALLIGRFDPFDLISRMSVASDDLRPIIWRESLFLIFRNPLGGGVENLSAHLWAHNFLLDIGLTTGFPGMAAILIGVIWMFWQCAQHALTWGRTPSPVSLLLLSLFLAVFAAANLSPPSLPYFVCSFMVGGYMASANLARRSALAASNPVPAFPAAPRLDRMPDDRPLGPDEALGLGAAKRLT